MIRPSITANLLDTVAQYTLSYLPGVATVSELMMGLDAGFRRFKFFPATVAGGVPALKAFSGPFKNTHFCPTGGINVNNFLEYLKLSNVECVGGSWLAPASLIEFAAWDAITQLATQAVLSAKTP